MAPGWQVQLLGEMQVVSGNRTLPLQGYRTIGPLLAFLAYHPGQQARDILVQHFWPGVEIDSARLSLRVALSRLRKLLGEESIVASVQQVGLQRSTFQVDTSGFLQLLEQVRQTPSADRTERRRCLEGAIALYQGPLLATWTDDWILSERERMESAYLGSIHQLVGMLTEQEEWETALAYTDKALITAPLYEEAHRDRIRVYLKMGRMEAARRQFQELEIRLQKEHYPPPSDLTRSLFRPLSLSHLPNTLPLIAQGEENVSSLSSLSSSVLSSLSSSVPSSAPVSVLGWLPDNLTHFFGREKEQEHLRNMLQNARNTRLITLAGLGGSGKTRLALEVGKSLQGHVFPSGIWWISLTEIQQEERILERILAVLQEYFIREDDSNSTNNINSINSVSVIGRVLDRIVPFLREYPALLILDNADKVPNEALRATLQKLLQAMPSLSLLVTSRRPLHFLGEQIIWVESLPIPPEQASEAEAIQSPALQMLLDRAQLQDASFHMTEQNLPEMIGLCRQLDGLPLALEMAASRFSAMSPGQVRARLSQRFALLVGTDNHSGQLISLRETLHWSYHLLTPASQKALRISCVFQGGWSLEAMEAVCDTPSLWEVLTELRDCSLVIAEETKGEKRFRMMDTVREMGEEWVSDEERQMICQAHAVWYADYARRMWEARDTSVFAGEIEKEYENLLAAVAWCHATWQQEEVARELWLELLISLTHYWWNHANFLEARRHLLAFLSVLEKQEDDAKIPVRCIYLVSFLVKMEVRAGRISQLPAYFSYFPLLERCQSRGPWSRIAVVTLRAYLQECLGEIEEAVRLYEQILEMPEIAQVNPEVSCNLLSEARGLYCRLGQFDKAEAMVNRSEQIARTHDKTFWLACSYAQRSDCEARRGDIGRARHYLQESQRLFTDYQERWWLVLLLRYRAVNALLAEEYLEAEDTLRDYCQACQRSGEMLPLLEVWDLLARALICQDKGRDALTLLGAGQMLRETLGFTFTEYEKTRFTTAIHDAHDSFSTKTNFSPHPLSESADTLWDLGYTLSRDDALQLVLPKSFV